MIDRKPERASNSVAANSSARGGFNPAFIDGLRAIAAFWVLTAHCMIWSAWSGPALPSPKLAVDLFMIISGFLLTYNARRRRRSEPLNDRLSWLKFYIRRMLRLAPAYYLALLCAVVLRGPFAGGYQFLLDHVVGFNIDISSPLTFSKLLMHIGFASGLVPSLVYATALPDWSLSLEVQFYLLFPSLIVLFIRLGVIKTSIVASVICAVFIIWNAGILSDGGEQFFSTPSFILLKLPVFLVGMLLCEAAVGEHGSYQRFWLRATAMLMCITQYPFYHGQLYWLALIAGTVLFLSTPQTGAGAVIQSKISRAMSGKISRYCSDISYSVYLFHGFFIAITGAALFGNNDFVQLPNWIRTALLWVITIVGTTLVASLVRALVEMPGIALGRKIVERIRPHSRPTEAIQAESRHEKREQSL